MKYYLRHVTKEKLSFDNCRHETYIYKTHPTSRETNRPNMYFYFTPAMAGKHRGLLVSIFDPYTHEDKLKFFLFTGTTESFEYLQRNFGSEYFYKLLNRNRWHWVRDGMVYHDKGRWIEE